MLTVSVVVVLPPLLSVTVKWKTSLGFWPAGSASSAAPAV